MSGLTKRYGAVNAVEDLTFSVTPGRVTGFLGPNGSGKTTTLRALVGLVTPTSGVATIFGRRYADLRDPARRVGVAISSDSFHPGRSARAHLDILAVAGGIERSRVDAVLDVVDLSSVGRQRVGGFSMGMRQRLALAGALLGDPDVLVLDEPLNGLDPDGIAWVRGLVRARATEGRTVLLSSHLLSEVAQTVDDVVVIDHGRLVVADRLDSLAGHAHTVVRTPDGPALAAALVADGMAARLTAEDRVEVIGASAEAVGRVAARERLVVTALSEDTKDLERLFHDLIHNPEDPS